MRKSIHSPEYRHIIEALRIARKGAGLTQEDLAKLLGSPQSFVAKYEKRERRLDVVELIRIAEAIGADVVPMVRSARSLIRSEKPRSTK